MPLDDADKKAIAEMIKTGLTEFGGELVPKFVTADAATKIVEQGLGKPDIAGTVKEALKGVKTGGDDDKDKKDKGEWREPAW